jgi:hypothetical protein
VRQSLEAGKYAPISFKLGARDRSIWDVSSHEWAEAKGKFGVTVGFSSRDPHALTSSFAVA